MSRKARRLVFLATLFALSSVTVLLAATQNAVIYGTVYNAAGNPMPDVTVVLENPALGFSRTTVTGSDGSYNFAEVPPADGYKVTARSAAKVLDIRAGITVNVGDERVILPPLTEQVQQAGAPEQPVARTAGGPAVRNETVSTAISSVITGDQLRTLPLYNRNFLTLGGLSPNVHDTEAGSELAGASFSVSGARPSQNNFLLDGADNVASSSNQAVPFQVNDAIQEFRVISSTANAEYGRNLGGTVNVVTRRGGNAFHGSAYGYFANDALNADNPLSVYNGTTFDKAAAYAGPVDALPADPSSFEYFTPFTYNQYVANAGGGAFGGNTYCTDSIGVSTAVTCVNGGTGANTRFNPAQILDSTDRFDQPFDSKQFGINMGGPFIKDKLFFFGSYEGTRIDNPNPIFERVPSLTFDRVANPLLARGVGVPFAFDPLTSADYQIASNIVNLFPEPNVIGVPDVLEFYRGEAPNYTRVHNILWRMDYMHSERTSFGLRYAVQLLNQLHDASLPATSTYPGNGGIRDAFNQNLSLTFGQTFSHNLINELRVGFSRFDVAESAQDAGFDATGLGLPFRQMPTILLNGLDTQYSGQTLGGPNDTGAYTSWTDCCNMLPWADFRFPFARLGAPLSAPSERRDTTWFISDSLSWSRGKHTLKFGADFRKLDNNLFNGAFHRGMMYSANIGEFTSDSETCTGAANCLDEFLRPSFDFAQFNPNYSGHFNSWAVAGYVQDTFRVHPRVTINLGLRYEYFSVPQEANDLIWNYDPAANGMVQANHSDITDPYGTACTPTPSWGSAPNGINFIGFLAFIADWQCDATAHGAQNIAKRDRNNFAPRVGIAFDPWGTGRTVIRGGFGMFYDHNPISYTSQLLYNRPMTAPNSYFGRVSLNLFPFGGPFPVDVCPNLSHQCGVGNSVLNSTDPFLLDYSLATQPFSVYARDTANSNTPWARQISFSVQQRLWDNLGIEVGYVGLAGENLPVIYDQNYANEWGVVGFQPASGQFNIARDTMIFFPIFTLTNRAESSYHSLLARVRIADFHGLRVNATYTLGKALDNASNAIFPTLPVATRNLLLGYQFFGNSNLPADCLLVTPLLGPERNTLCARSIPAFPFIDFSTGAVTTTGAGQILTSRYNIPQDPFNFLVNDRGPSDFDTRQRLVVDYTWDIPSLEKAWGWPKWADNWTLSGIFVAQTGQPFSVFAGPIAGAITQRADVGGSVEVDYDNPDAAIDPTNILLPGQNIVRCPAGQLTVGTTTFMPRPGEACMGFSGRNIFTGPMYINMNFAVQKAFQVAGEGRTLVFRAEIFNLLNRANYYNPISATSDNGFTPSGDFGTIKSAHEPRQVQLAVRFNW